MSDIIVNVIAGVLTLVVLPACILGLFIEIYEVGLNRNQVRDFFRIKSRTERIVRKEVKRLEREIKDQERLKDLYKRLEQLQERDKL